MSIDVVTFGCRLNAYESEAIKLRAGEAQLRDTVIVNTCAVTAEAVRQSRQAIRKLRREHPTRRIIVTGCAAQIAPQTYAAMEEVDLVIGNAEKLEAATYAAFGQGIIGQGAAERVRVNDIMSVRETAAQFVDSFDGRSRAFLQVQNGCDHRCTFCIIPYARGNARSVPMAVVVSEARRLTENGFAEIVLTGVDLTAYGADLLDAPSLGTLVTKILKQAPGVKRLRLSSIDSIEVDDALMRAIAQEERLMPHFHLSAQSGDDMILKRMKRRHTRRDTIAFCEAVRRVRPEAAFGADLIAGFPTETDAMFENSVKLVDDAGLSYLHVFPFSARETTPAAKMPKVPGAAIKARAATLRAKGAAALDARLESLVGSTQAVLIEQNGAGHTPCFAPVQVINTQITGAALTPGAIVNARITGLGPARLLADSRT